MAKTIRIYDDGYIDLNKKYKKLKDENVQLKQQLKTKYIVNKQYEELQRLKQENEQLKEERNYFERKKCEYFNKYNKKHLDNIQLKEEIKDLNDVLARYEEKELEE